MSPANYLHHSSSEIDAMNTPIYEPLAPASSAARNLRSDSTDAIALLMADHRRVERRFLEFQMTTSMRREEELAMEICDVIRIHADLDGEIFYPAYLQATRDRHHYQFALAQHAQIKDLIDEIEKLALTEESSLFAKLHRLHELFEQHVRMEEKTRGIFTRAQESPMDLEAVGRAWEMRQEETTAVY
jgi:hypothetical protein